MDKWEHVMFQVEVHLLDYWFNRLATKLRAKFLEYSNISQSMKEAVALLLYNPYLFDSYLQQKNPNT